MGTAASINVNLNARISNFLKGMKRGMRALNKFADRVGKVARKVAFMGTAIAAVGAGAMVLMIQKGRTAIDTVAKLSDRLGVATEALLTWQYAGRLAGASTEDISKGVEKLVINLGKAKIGLMAQADAVAQLGLNVDDLIGMGTEKAFLQIADAISRIREPAVRAQIAMDMFGRSGVKMLNMLSGGSDGLAKARAELASMGGLFSREEAARVEQMNDAIERMKTAWQGVAQYLTITVAPIVTAIVDKFRVKLPELMRKMIDWMHKVLPVVVATVANMLQTISVMILKSLEFATATLMRILSNMSQLLIDFSQTEFARFVFDDDTLTSIHKMGLGIFDAADELAGAATMMRNAAESVEGQDWGLDVIDFVNRAEETAAAFGKSVAVSAAKAMSGMPTIMDDVGDSIATTIAESIKKVLPTVAEFKLAGAVSRGSEAAYSAVAQAGVGSRTEKAQQEQVRLQYSMNERLGRIDHHLANVSGVNI